MPEDVAHAAASGSCLDWVALILSSPALPPENLDPTKLAQKRSMPACRAPSIAPADREMAVSPRGCDEFVQHLL